MVRSFRFATGFLMSVAAVVCHGESIRSYHVGNSLTEDAVVGAFPEFADQRGFSHETGWHIYRGKSLPFIVSNPRPSKQGGYSSKHGFWDQALKNERWDVVTLQIYPSDGSTLASDVAAVEQLIATTRQNQANRDTRFIIYGPWDITGEKYSQRWEEVAELNDESPTDRRRQYFDEVWRRVQAAVPDADISLLMTGELLFSADQHIKQAGESGGSWLGFASLKDLYRDQVHLNGQQGRWLASLAMWAAVTGKDPSGLKRPADHFKASGSNPLDEDAALRNGLSQFVSESMDKIYLRPSMTDDTKQ